MKMSVVGCEASGKTVFMSALADYYNGNGRPCLVPENESANNFQRYQLRQMRNFHQWPAATDPGKTIELKWSLRKDGKVLSEIDMLEFGGETFREAFRGESASSSHQEAVEALKHHLASSEFVVVLVSLKDLLRDQGSMSAEEFERDTEALWVTRGLLSFLHEQAPSARVVIGLTQADLHRGELAAAGGADKLLQRQWASVAAVAHDYPVLPIASVSATDADGNPAPDYTTDGILPVMDEFRKANAKAKPLGKGSSVTMRTLLLFALLAALGALWLVINGDKPTSTAAKATPPAAAPTPPPQPPVLAKPASTKAAATNATECTITTSNLVFHIVTETNAVKQTTAPTNTIGKTKAAVPTNYVNQIAAATNAPAAAPAPVAEYEPSSVLRVWHDHNGTPIEAKWIATTDDRKRIILETADGKRIRAAIRKFSVEDRKFIAERLKGK